jgi:hypothetical protein
MPKEHPLGLGRSHVLELADAFHDMRIKPVTTAYPDFSIVVVRKAIPDGFQAGDGSALQKAVAPAQ